MAFLFTTIDAGARQARQDAPHSVTVKGLKNASPWFRAESANFIVLSDTRHEDVFHLLNHLEKLDHVLRLFTRDYYVRRAAGQKIRLYYHKGMAGFNQAAANLPAEAVGLYSSCVSDVLGYGVNLQRPASLGNEQLAQAPLDASLSYIFEAYTRHFLYRNTNIRMPDWYIEGFAQYFSSARFSDGQMVLGRPPAGVSRYFAFIDQGDPRPLEYDDVFKPALKPADRGFTAKAEQQLAFQAKSWNLMHYMLATSDGRARLDRYLELTQDDAPAAALEDALGLKAAGISTTLWRYRIKGIALPQVDIPSLPAARIHTTALPEAATDYILADAALRSCPGKNKGEALLRTLSQQAGDDAGNQLAGLTLSRAQNDWGNPEDALPFLAEAVRRDPSNFDAHYLLGQANLRLHRKRAAPARLAAAGKHLARAMELNPASAEAAFAFHKAGLAGNERPGAAVLDSAVTAWKNAREASQLARSAALAYAYSGRAPEADGALTLLAQNARDPAMAGWAKAWQAKLAAGVNRTQLLEEMRREPDVQDAFREWTLSGEDLMKTVEYNAGVEKSQRAIDQLRMADPMGERIYNTPTKR